MSARFSAFSVIVLVLVLVPAARPVAAAGGLVDSNAGLPGVARATTAWGDVDGDGDLDLLLAGSTDAGLIAEVYTNDGQGGFTDSNAGLPGVSPASAAWGDVDNDGDLDLLLAGCTVPSCFSGIAEVYTNDGQGRFTDTNAGLPGLTNGAAALGDVDGDGDLDLLLAGVTFSGITATVSTKVYTNDGRGSFTDSNAGLPGLILGAAAFGDVDNDGDLDLLLAGNTGELIAEVYTNNGRGGFTASNAGLPGVSPASAAWGDVDNDGDLDLLLAGDTSTEPITEVYTNDGRGGFTGSGAGLPGLATGTATFGDVDNDGALDLILAGDSGAGPATRLLLNLGSDGGWGDHPTPLPGVYDTAAFGDVDGDGDLDLVLAGFTGAERIARVYRNTSDMPNTPPAAPTELEVELNGTTAVLRWNAASDTQTPAAGLTYNLRVGTTPGGADVLSAMARSDGRRLLPTLGNTFHRTARTISGLNPTTAYYWSVQAIDSAFAASPFATGRFVDYPGLSIGDVRITEGAAGTPTAVVNVTLNGPTRRLVTVSFSTANITAVAGRDYTATAGSLSFPPGATRATIRVPITPDTGDEPIEFFLVNLRSPSNASLADGVSVGTIMDDDAAPGISIGDVIVAEGHARARNVSFIVSLSAASPQPVIVDFATANGSPAAAAGQDYLGTAGTLAFRPGVTAQRVSVPVLGDTVDEPHETFVVTLRRAANATIADAQGVGTITDDD